MSIFKIRKLFKFRTQRKFRTELQADGWVNDILKSNKNIEYYITSKPITDNCTKSDINEILNKGFYISAVFCCGNIFTNMETEVCLFIFDKSKPETIKLGYHELKSCNTHKTNQHLAEVNTNLPKDYNQYIFDIEQWINNDKKPKDFGQNKNYGEIKYEKYFPKTELNPLYYLENLKRKAEVEKNAKLSDYAEIIVPQQLTKFKEMGVKVLSAEKYNETFDFNSIETSFPTNTVLLENDILINYQNALYINQKKYTTPVYIAPYNQFVIRAKKDTNPKALYCILKSDEDLSYNDISPEMPVIKINTDIDYNKFYDNLTGKIHTYTTDISDNNLAQALKSCAFKQMQAVIKNDLDEIDRCYKSKAYKAALILCGSVLEAFLYDWLLEKFQEQNKKIDKNWTLKDYITEIQELYKPEWLSAAEKADKIRHKRNLIHPEQYVKYDSVIDQTLCDNMRKYLKYVIETRSKL